MTVTIQLGDPGPDHECPTCGFDSCGTFPVYGLSGDGVQMLGWVHACGRCDQTQTEDA